MTAAIHNAVHQDHRLWESQICFWREDIAEWQMELAQSREYLKELEAAIHDQEENLAAACRFHSTGWGSIRQT
jgi:hypothetical protein